MTFTPQLMLVHLWLGAAFSLNQSLRGATKIWPEIGYILLLTRLNTVFTILFLRFSENDLAGCEFGADTTLNDYIRNEADVRGTKFMCQEGGCGACVVAVTAPHPLTRDLHTFSVNSCLVPIFVCQGWDVATTEGIGNRNKGYHIIQKRLNSFFGTQCGYCSPGWVMSMYSLMKSKGGHITEAEIENSFGSNICRCTGYRPIIEAFRSLAVNAHPRLQSRVEDIEDLEKLICSKSGEPCAGLCDKREEDWCILQSYSATSIEPLMIQLSDGRAWFSVSKLEHVFKIMEESSFESYMLVAGNTARGAYPIKEYPRILIDINGVEELRTSYIDQNLVLGANTTISDTMKLFEELACTNQDFWYLEILNHHLDRVAHIPVRNVGTLAGNLFLKHEHPEFQSDVFILFATLGAVLTIVDSKLNASEMGLAEFLEYDMKGKIIRNIRLPPLSREYRLVTYKVAPREQNAHAHVNAGFLIKMEPLTNIVQEATIVYGGIHPGFTHAYSTEAFLKGRILFHNEVLQSALQCLEGEIFPDFNPPEPQPVYRKKLALALFYKCIIKLCPDDTLGSRYKSGGVPLQRPAVSHSYQEYDTNKPDFPITQPLLKKEGLIQCSGEAIFSDDYPTGKHDVFAAFVLSTITKGYIEAIDGSDALKVDGVIAVYTSEDIPGVNSFIRPDFNFMFEKEEILSSGRILYYNQPVALVVAKTDKLAQRAIDWVKVKYRDVSEKLPVLTIEQAIAAPREDNRVQSYEPTIKPTDRGTNVKKVIKGKFYTPGQYHNTLELNTCITIPIDNGFEVHSSTQWTDLNQAVIADMLNMPESSIVCRTRRVGGAFGFKISRAALAACGSALVASLQRATCRLVMPMTQLMSALGKRCSSLTRYEVGVDDEGRIQYMNADFYVNDGASHNENENALVILQFPNCYDPARWRVGSYAVLTDLPPNCFFRAPGGCEAVASIENIMEHIAVAVKRDPTAVRLVNMRQNDNTLPALIPFFQERVDYEERLENVKKFNQINRWKKRAIKLTNMSFPTAYVGNYSALVSVFHGDGSVVVSAGGIEMGQGIFTKLAQVAAFILKVPFDTVFVEPTSTVTTPNNNTSGSSITTECCAYAVQRACEQINSRLAPIRVEMPEASFQEVVAAADKKGISLQANYQTSENDPRLVNYSIFGVAIVEVEVDILTGNHMIVRADVLEDTGKSMNPALDVGQVESAFIQGLSYWTMEHLVYDERTGKILTNRTWNYRVMGAKDIPADFRVYLQRHAYNPVGILGSKAAGEPPICMGQVIIHALMQAVNASKEESGRDVLNYYNIGVPVTTENVVKAASVCTKEFLLY